MNLVDLTIKEFSEVLASKEPVPGGGSVAALTGLLGADLTLMVANLSFGKKSYEELDGKIKSGFNNDYEIIKQIKCDLYKLIDEDKAVFLRYMDVLKLAKDTDEEKKVRREAIEKASIFALSIPMITAESSLEILKHQRIIAEYGNKGAISDVGVSALLIFSTIESAVLNVKINLTGISDDAYKKEIIQKTEKIITESRKLKNNTLEIVNRRI